MNLKQLEAFVKVAEYGNFSKAARALFLTQPTVSAHIASLEAELDARLFIRNTKEVTLSESGEKLYVYANQMVGLEKKIREVFEEEREMGRKCITIAASTIPAQYILPRILSEFMEKYPDEQFKVEETDSTRVVEKVVARQADIGFTGTVLEKKHCEYIPFYIDDLVIIAPPSEFYREKKTDPYHVEWICEEPLIMREEGSGTRREAEKQLKALGIATEDLNVVATIANQETIKRSVMSGMGISVISGLAVKDEVESGRLLSFPIYSKDGGRAISLLYNKNFHLSSSADKFVRFVKKEKKTVK